MTSTFGSHKLKMSKYLFSFKLLSFFFFFSPRKRVTVVQNTFVTPRKFPIAELWTSEHTGLKWKCWHNLKCSGTNTATTIILVIQYISPRRMEAELLVSDSLSEAQFKLHNYSTSFKFYKIHFRCSIMHSKIFVLQRLIWLFFYFKEIYDLGGMWKIINQV